MLAHQLGSRLSDDYKSERSDAYSPPCPLSPGAVSVRGRRTAASRMQLIALVLCPVVGLLAGAALALWGY